MRALQLISCCSSACEPSTRCVASIFSSTARPHSAMCGATKVERCKRCSVKSTTIICIRQTACISYHMQILLSYRNSNCPTFTSCQQLLSAKFLTKTFRLLASPTNSASSSRCRRWIRLLSKSFLLKKSIRNSCLRKLCVRSRQKATTKH